MSYDFLIHYGVKGQRWGLRRFQNPDGSYTDAGKKRYEKYSEIANNYAKTSKDMSYWRKKTEKEGKRRGEAWGKYGAYESETANKAVKYQNKANKYATESDKKDMRKELTEAGVEIDKYSKRNQHKAEASEYRAALKAKRGDEERAGREAYDRKIMKQAAKVGLSSKDFATIAEDTYLNDKVKSYLEKYKD